MENFHKCENDKHGNKFDIKFVSEYGHSQASFHDSLTDPVIYSFDLRLSQGAQKDLHEYFRLNTKPHSTDTLRVILNATLVVKVYRVSAIANAKFPNTAMAILLVER